MTNEEALRFLDAEMTSVIRDPYKDDWKVGNQIGALEMGKMALGKRIPKKPKKKFKDVIDGKVVVCRCKNCGNEVGILIYKNNIKTAPFTESFCSNCGQRQNWSEDD